MMQQSENSQFSAVREHIVELFFLAVPCSSVKDYFNPRLPALTCRDSRSNGDGIRPLAVRGGDSKDRFGREVRPDTPTDTSGDTRGRASRIGTEASCGSGRRDRRRIWPGRRCRRRTSRGPYTGKTWWRSGCLDRLDRSLSKTVQDVYWKWWIISNVLLLL